MARTKSTGSSGKKPRSPPTPESDNTSRRSKRRQSDLWTPSPESKELLNRASTRVHRDVPIRPSFVDLHAYPPRSDPKPPLAMMLTGSKGAALRLRLYLALLWQAGGGDQRHRVTFPARAWATLLDLPDRAGLGERRIRDALAYLERQTLVEIVPRPGWPSHIVLLREDRSGKPYTNPAREAHVAKRRGLPVERRRYITVPEEFFTRGWAHTLSAPAISMLLVMLVMRRADTQPRYIAPTEARSRFGLSDDTWGRGTRELKEHGVLAVGKMRVSPDFGMRRVRNTYRLEVVRLRDPP